MQLLSSVRNEVFRRLGLKLHLCRSKIEGIIWGGEGGGEMGRGDENLYIQC